MQPPALDEQHRSLRQIEVDAELVENISTLVDQGQQGMVLNLLVDLHAADVALLLTHLAFDQAQRLFRWLPVEVGGDVLAELEDTFRAELLEETTQPRLTALLDEVETDDAADILADLPEEVVAEVLPTLEDAADVEALLRYDEETAGGLMATEFVAVPETCTVAEVTEEVRNHADLAEDIYVVYVVDATHRLQGFIKLKQLLLSPAETPVARIMDDDIVSAPTDLDQEDVARLMERYDLVSLPVVDAGGVLVGRVTIDDAVDVIRDEAEEDIQRMSGVGDEEPTDSVFRIIRGRLPWLFIGLVGAALSSLVILSFEEELAEAVVLASFIPIVMAMAGNAGIQSSAIAVQGLASGDVWTTDMMRRLGKELAVALLNGIALSLALAVLVVLLLPLVVDMPVGDAPVLALTSAISLLIVIILAATIGATVPLLLDRVGIDPAIATGPFIMTSNDILGLAVYFLIAKVFYLP